MTIDVGLGKPFRAPEGAPDYIMVRTAADPVKNAFHHTILPPPIHQCFALKTRLAR